MFVFLELDILWLVHFYKSVFAKFYAFISQVLAEVGIVFLGSCIPKLEYVELEWNIERKVLNGIYAIFLEVCILNFDREMLFTLWFKAAGNILDM